MVIYLEYEENILEFMAEKNKKILNETVNSIKEENKNDTKDVIKNVELTEKDSDNKTQNENIEPKKISNNNFIIPIAIVILIMALLLFLKKEKVLNIFKAKAVKEIDKQEEIYENLRIDKEFYTKTFQKLSENIKVLEREVEFNGEYIKTLQAKVAQLEAELSDINIAPQRTELIKIAINIQSKISKGLSYSEELSTLRLLAKDNSILLEKINMLDVYKNKYPTEKIILQNFKTELEIFIKEHNILKNNNNRVSKFLSNFIVVRKIENVEDNTSDAFIIKLKNAIETRNYGLSLEMLKINPEYKAFFPKTTEYINTIVLLNNTIEEIINYLINN